MSGKKNKLKKVVKCMCGELAIVYRIDGKEYFRCFACNKHCEVTVYNQELYPDYYTKGIREVLMRFNPKLDLPRTASWLDLKLALIGVLDVTKVKMEAYRKQLKQRRDDSQTDIRTYLIEKH